MRHDILRWPVGKVLPDAVYVHTSALDQIPQKYQKEAYRALNMTSNVADVVKFARDGSKLTLLKYPDFETVAFPELVCGWTVRPNDKAVEYKNYRQANPFILHRKEQIVSDDYPLVYKFAALTQACEAVGLFENTRIIGRKIQWDNLIRSKGLRVIGHTLVPA